MRLRAVAFALATLLSVPCAFADTFSFTASAGGFSAIGTLAGTKDPYNATAFDIQSGTATINGAAYTIYTPSGNSSTPLGASFPGSGPYASYTYDNVVYTTGTALDFNGLLFAGTANHYNLYFANGHFNATNDFDQNGTPISFVAVNTTTVTPEPSGLALLGTGILGLLGATKRREVTPA